MNAEINPDTVLYQDVACKVETGFIGENKELIDNISDLDHPARFQLKNLL